MLALITVLQRDLKVRYNMNSIYQPDFTNSKDQFIHGMVLDTNGGTCVSMPVLYAAVGRRLGYPIKLVLAKEHVFCRWDDGVSPALNIEGSSMGMHSFPDTYYLTWPRPIDARELQHREFLVSLTPQEELSVFLAARGHCLADSGRLHDSIREYRAAIALFPSCTSLRTNVAEAESRLLPAPRVMPGLPQNPLRTWGMPDLQPPRR